MPRIQVSVSDELDSRLRERALQTGAPLASMMTTLLDLALRIGGESPTPAPENGNVVLGPPRPATTKPEKPKPGPRDPVPNLRAHNRKDRPAVLCPTRELVDGRCPTCGATP